MVWVLLPTKTDWPWGTVHVTFVLSASTSASLEYRWRCFLLSPPHEVGGGSNRKIEMEMLV